MDCCGEFRAHGQYGASASTAWEYAPYSSPYAPYAHYYPPHDPYRYYRYDYSHHAHHSEHAMPMDYGAYASKESRVRRAMARRDARAIAPSHYLPLPHTPPLECGMNGRNPYCEPQMWPPYQMGVGGGWNGANAMGGAWMSRNTCSREHMRYPADCRPFKGPHLHPQSQCPPDGRSTPYPVYEESMYNGESNVRHRNTSEYGPAGAAPAEARPVRDRPAERPPEPRRPPPEEKRPPVVPLPAFQQAFGSTEIGKFAEAFSREVIIDDSSNNYEFESFPDWDGPSDQWPSQPASREIKCEDNY